MDDSVNVSDVRMIERTQNFSFTMEAGHAIRIAQKCRRQNFQRHVGLERRVPRAVYLAHTALAEQGDHFIVTEFVAYRKRHLSDLSQFS